jgi:hypothetical protein
MINPNKLYQAKSVFVVTAIVNPLSNIAKIYVRDNQGNEFYGWLGDLTKNVNRFKIGDVVKISCQFSIVSDRFMIKRLTKVRESTTLKRVNAISSNSIRENVKLSNFLNNKKVV